MKISKYFIFFLGFVFLVLVFLIKTDFFSKKEVLETKPELEKVKISMGYIPNVQFAPFYVALDKEYFKNQGLEIEFDYGFETDIIQLLGKNELQFGIGSGEQVIIARSQGLPIVNFFNWYQRFPVCLTSLKEKNITEPKDLINKKVGVPVVYGASYIGLQAFLAKNNLSEDQIKLEVVGYTQVESLTEGKIDVAVCYQMNEPVQLETLRYEVNNIEVADYVNFVSNGLLTNEKMIKEKPELVQAMAKAFSQGLEEVINNPEQAFLISQKYIPEMEEEEAPKAVLKESIKFWQGEKFGWNDSQQWQDSVDFLKEIDLIEEKPSLEGLFTNQFLQ